MNPVTWWNERQPREKLVLALGVVAVLLTGLFLLLEPVYEEHQYRSAEIPRLEDDLFWMQAQSTSLEGSRKAPTSSPASSVTVVQVEKLIKLNKLSGYLGSMKPLGAGGVSLSFDKVPYGRFIDFIYSARAEFGPAISKVSLQPLQEEEGMISVSMELAGPGRG